MSLKNLKPGTILTFGKHKGKAIDEVPDYYLEWITEQDWFEKDYPALAGPVEAELEYRDFHNQHIRS